MQDNLLEYESPCYYIGIPYKTQGQFLYDFVAYAENEDDTPIRCDNKIITVTSLTVFEDFALMFRHLDEAIDWAYENLPKLKHEIEEMVPGYFDWDKTAIIKKEYTVIPLGKI